MAPPAIRDHHQGFQSWHHFLLSIGISIRFHDAINMLQVHGDDAMAIGKKRKRAIARGRGRGESCGEPEGT